jgi:hypothetical protein
METSGTVTGAVLEGIVTGALAVGGSGVGEA